MQSSKNLFIAVNLLRISPWEHARAMLSYLATQGVAHAQHVLPDTASEEVCRRMLKDAFVGNAIVAACTHPKLLHSNKHEWMALHRRLLKEVHAAADQPPKCVCSGHFYTSCLYLCFGAFEVRRCTALLDAVNARSAPFLPSIFSTSVS